jgi:uncharacterized protein (TIGR03083 family)
MGEQLKRPADIIATLITSWRSLSDLGAGLTEAQWKTATDLPGWSVQDTLSHIIGTERLLEGLPTAQSPPGASAQHVLNKIGEFNEREVAARRGRSGTDVLAEWNELRVLRERTLAEADDSYFAQPALTPTGSGTMTDFLAMRIIDCWIHEQDMRRSLALPTTITGSAAARTIDALTASLPMIVGKRAACPDGSAIAIELTGSPGRSFLCVVDSGRASFVDASPTSPDAHIVMDAECYLLLATGRRTVTDLTERVDLRGDTQLAARVVDNLNVML